jgi:hypothetical protein
MERSLLALKPRQLMQSYNYDAIQATKLFEPAKLIFTARVLWLPTQIFRNQ